MQYGNKKSVSHKKVDLQRCDFLLYTVQKESGISVFKFDFFVN